MPLYEIYSHPERSRYNAYFFSSSTFFLITCLILGYLSPIFIAYFTGGFWRKELIYSEQPRVNYIRKYILLVENDVADNNSKIFLSSNSTYNQILGTLLLHGSQTSSFQDLDSDGIPDQWKIIFNVPLDNNQLTSLNVWLFFDYQLNGRQQISMETLGLISLVPPIGLTTKIVTIYGQLQFEQNQPIKSHGSDSTLDTSIFPDNIQPLDNILSNYFSRTYYTLFKQQYIQWTSSIQEPSTLQVTVVLNVGRQTVRYVPSFWEEFKWGLIQYTAVLIPLLFLINKAKEFLFANQLVRTIVHTSNNKRHKA